MLPISSVSEHNHGYSASTFFSRGNVWLRRGMIEYACRGPDRNRIGEASCEVNPAFRAIPRIPPLARCLSLMRREGTAAVLRERRTFGAIHF